VCVLFSEENTAAVFWQNPSETWIDINPGSTDRAVAFPRLSALFGDEGRTDPKVDTHWFFESGVIDLFVMLGPKPADVSRQYALLTGATPLPPVSGAARSHNRRRCRSCARAAEQWQQQQ